jgi:organic hydroperoxide reductase OsmC/OhrA
VSPRPKRTDYSVAVERSGRAYAEGRIALEAPEGWTPEHVVLFALAACSLTSLRHHVRRAGLDHSASATATGAIGPREDGSWGFLEIACAIDADIDPAPSGNELPALLASAERGCFVGASLQPKPAYRWTVNGVAP